MPCSMYASFFFLWTWLYVIALQYEVQEIPATFILDASGKIVAKNLRGNELRNKIVELLGK